MNMATAEGSVKKFFTMHVCVVGAKPVIDGEVVVTETTFGTVKECVWGGWENRGPRGRRADVIVAVNTSIVLVGNI